MAERRVSDRYVLLVAAAVVVGVVVFAWVTDLVPGLREGIAFGPVISVALVVVTVLVLAHSFKRSSR